MACDCSDCRPRGLAGNSGSLLALSDSELLGLITIERRGSSDSRYIASGFTLVDLEAEAKRRGISLDKPIYLQPWFIALVTGAVIAFIFRREIKAVVLKQLSA